MATALIIIGGCLLLWGIFDKFSAGKGKFFALMACAMLSASGVRAAEMTEEQIVLLLTLTEQTTQNTENTYALCGLMSGLLMALIATSRIRF